MFFGQDYEALILVLVGARLALSRSVIFLFLGRNGYRGVHLSGLKRSVPGLRILSASHRTIEPFDRLWQDMNQGNGNEESPGD